MAFTDEIHDEADEFWSAIVAHPMVEQLGTGSLDVEPFKYWVRQDYLYLVEYSRLFALGATKAPTLDSMGTFASLLESTVNEEMDLHRGYATEFGISTDELEATTPSPTTRAYTDFLVRTATLGTFGDIVAALLPCMWGFNETGRRLAANGIPDHKQYAAWVEMYTGDEFTELTEWCKTLMDDVAAAATPTTRERYRELFRTSAQYEYKFWDAAWRQEEWPL
ncbi:transcriptional activator TenA [Haloferax mucosum ATCC BAA-1512]|uniref:Transcriptional activator TenA n=1 Tax=Haloferax mucosum ATCC BAA-1512 TaxID=662479 RepID=M0IGM7_9EURY|nr:thiaminase II [Haloferax mucosum]ELZ95921.1 transcriptional activator TenA [Haloferax mucosum ATCC BAA-1512]